MLVNPTKDLWWSFSEKVVRLFFGTALTLLIARQIGPAEFGIFSTVFAIFMMFTALAGLGLKDIVIDEIASSRSDHREILSSAAGLMFFAGTGLALTFAGASVLFYPPLSSQMWVSIILSVVLLFKGFDALLFGLEAQAKLRATAVAQQTSIFASATAKTVLLIIGANAISFAAVTTLEFLALYTTLIFLAARQEVFLSFASVRREHAIRLLKRSWPLIASSLSVIGYFYVDQIVIAILMDSNAVGLYATASRISQQLYVLPAILVSAYYPRLTRINAISQSDFTSGFIALSVVLIILSLGSYGIIFLLGASATSLVLGEQFNQTGEILTLHAAGLIFVSLNIISSRWYVMRGLQRLSMVRQLITFAMNIALNFLLIPFLGIKGAVVATLISLLFLAFGFDYLSSSTRELFRIKLTALKLAIKPQEIIKSFALLRNM